MTSIPRVVFVSPLAPAGSANGLAMRAGMLLDALDGFASVDVVVVPVSGPGDDLAWAAARARSVCVVAPLAGVDARGHVAAQLADARLRARLESTAPLPGRAAAVPPTLASDALSRIPDCLEPRVVLGMRSYLAPFAAEIAARLGADRLVIDLDDDDEALCRSLGEHAEAEAFHRLARAWLPDADVVLAASPIEAHALARRHSLRRVDVVPNAVHLPPSTTPIPAGAGMLFVGNLTYPPNVEAATTLVDEVLPRVRERRPDATADLVGPAIPGTLERLRREPGVRLAGFVPDLAPWYASATVVVAPLRHGGGTRIKVLEAFAYRRPVVTTSVGVAGLDVVDGEHVLVGETADELAGAVLALLDDPGRAAALAERAWQLLAHRYVPPVVGPRVRAAVLGCHAGGTEEG